MEFGGEELDESAKWRDPKYKDQLYTQEKPDYNDTREYDRAMWYPKPKGYPGRKELPGGDEYDRTDPLVKGFGRYGVGEPVSKGPRKGLPSRDQITSLKQSIRDISGRHVRANLPEQGMAEGGQRLGRPNDTDWDETSGKVGRVEKTSTGLRHHADPSRYGGTEHEPELNRLNKGAVNAMDRALGVKWDRESNRYYSPLKVDMEEGGQEPGADYRDPPETDYDATGHDASVARLKHLAGVGPMKTVYDPNKRVYRNMPTAVQPKRS
jgi:hypothetical protein